MPKGNAMPRTSGPEASARSKKFWRGQLVGIATCGRDGHLMTDEEFEADWAEMRRVEHRCAGLGSVVDASRTATDACPVFSRSRPVYDSTDLRRSPWKLGGRNRSSGDWGGPHGGKESPCQCDAFERLTDPFRAHGSGSGSSLAPIAQLILRAKRKLIPTTP
jgi:hypothetical protein